MNKLTIKVKNKNTNEIMFECNPNEASKAYKFATEMERYNIQTIIDAPNSLETLFSSLTPSSEDITQLNNEINNELDSHN